MTFTRTQMSQNVMASDKAAPRMTVLSTPSNATLRVSDAYALKDALKARGYTFDGKSAEWVFVAAQLADAMDEIIWADDTGIEIFSPGRKISVDRMRAARAAAAA